MDKIIYETLFDLVEGSSEEAFASISLNPAVTWAKFILTDDQPNKNKQRIPEDEFVNLIRTGVYMPIKMAVGGINDGHDGAVPIGVISHLKRVNNQVQGLAAMWDKERPEDIQYIRERYAKKEPLQLSWEVLYDSANKTEDGIEELIGTSLRAVTLVGMPAYAGRTPITAVASDSNTEDTKLEELEQLHGELETVKASLSAKEQELTTANEELAQLREFKAQVDKVKADEEKFASIKQSFKEAGLERDEEYFNSNKDRLLSLDEAALDFVIQEAVSFASANDKGKKPESTSSTDIPPISGGRPATTNDILEYLKSSIQ